MGKPSCFACGQVLGASPACDTWACDPCPACGQCRLEGPAHRRQVPGRLWYRDVAFVNRPGMRAPWPTSA